MVALFWVYFLTEVCSGSVQSTSMELLPEVSVWENQRRLPLMDFNKSLLTPVDPGPWSDGNSDGNFTGTGEITLRPFVSAHFPAHCWVSCTRF